MGTCLTVKECSVTSHYDFALPDLLGSESGDPVDVRNPVPMVVTATVTVTQIPV
jgi:hypothetical protein